MPAPGHNTVTDYTVCVLPACPHYGQGAQAGQQRPEQGAGPPGGGAEAPILLLLILLLLQLLSVTGHQALHRGGGLQPTQAGEALLSTQTPSLQLLTVLYAFSGHNYNLYVLYYWKTFKVKLNAHIY